MMLNEFGTNNDASCWEEDEDEDITTFGSIASTLQITQSWLDIQSSMDDSKFASLLATDQIQRTVTLFNQERIKISLRDKTAFILPPKGVDVVPDPSLYPVLQFLA